MADLHVVLVAPEIHWNTGNAGRTCLAAGAQLHLVGPLGFSLDDSVGLPDDRLAAPAADTVAIPMLAPSLRSLNLSTSVALALYEVRRQWGWA